MSSMHGTWGVSSLAFALCLLSGAARAQAPADGTAAAAGSEPGWKEKAPAAAAPAATPAKPAEVEPARDDAAAAATPSVVPAPASETAFCSLDAIDGVDDASARTAAALVCEAIEVRRAKTPRAVKADATFVVSVRKLGSSMILALSERGPGDVVRASRQVTLARIEETTTAAPRLVDSLLDGVPLKSTERVDNLTAEETRVKPTRSGRTSFAVGLLGTSLPQANVWLAPGLELGFVYESTNFLLNVDGRVAWFTGHAGGAYTGVSIGADYLFSTENTSPYLGGGLGLSYLGARRVWDKEQEEGRSRDTQGGGLAAFVEGGFEFMRLEKTRLMLGLRMDLPFYLVESEAYTDYRYETPCHEESGYTSCSPTREEQEAKSHYAVPLTLNLRLLF